MSKRTICRWRKAAGSKPPSPGRPPYRREELKRARRDLTRAIEVLGWKCGWRTFSQYLPDLPTWLIQRMLAQLKLEYRRRIRKHRQRNRKSVTILARGAMLAQDSAHLGRARAKASVGEVAKDCASLKTRAFGPGRPLKAADVVRQLKRLKARGRLPLVWSTDNAKIYTCD